MKTLIAAAAAAATLATSASAVTTYSSIIDDASGLRTGQIVTVDGVEVSRMNWTTEAELFAHNQADFMNTKTYKINSKWVGQELVSVSGDDAMVKDSRLSHAANKSLRSMIKAYLAGM